MTAVITTGRGAPTSSSVTITTINGQPVVTFVDTTRANKILSIETVTVIFSNGKINNNDFMRIGEASQAATGYIIPLNATIVKITAHTVNNKGTTKSFDLYVDDILNTSNIASFLGPSGQDEFSDITLNIDITQNQKIQLRAGTTGGKIGDTVIVVWLKWRG